MQFSEPDEITVERIHRLPFGPKNKRPIIVKLLKYADREAIWQRRKYLKDSGVTMSEDFPGEIDKKRKMLFPIMKAAQKDGQRASLVIDKLMINGNKYTCDTVKKLPKYDEYVKENSEMREGNFVFFFGKSCPFSNFHPASFSLDGNRFNCAEQFIQLSKARLFKDEKTADLILKSKHPEEQKQLGRQVVNFDPQIWKEAAKKLIVRGLAQKFDENPDLRQYLKDTGDKQLVECSAYDTLFGIGMNLQNKLKNDSQKWEGQNIQGEMLQEIRGQLT